MVRRLLAGGVSLLLPGLGHILINFQFMKGIVIVFLYWLLLMTMLVTIPTMGLIGFIAGLIALPTLHIVGALWAMSDAP